MNKNERPLLRAVSTGILSAVLTFVVTTPASAAPDGRPKMEDNWAAHQAQLHAHLDKEAAHLGIRPAQQAQWQEYAQAVESRFGDHRHQLSPDADAVAIARQRADMAAAHAAKLAKIADATAALQAVLTPEQRSIFARMARRAGPHGDHPHPPGDRPSGAPAE
jgi:hypothetical protein